MPRDQQVPSPPYPQALRLGQRGRVGKRAEIPSRGQKLQELASRGQNSVPQSQHHGVSVIRGAEGGVEGGVGHPSQLRGKCLTWTAGADIFQHFISCKKGRKTTVGFPFLLAGSQSPPGGPLHYPLAGKKALKNPPSLLSPPPPPP